MKTQHCPCQFCPSWVGWKDTVKGRASYWAILRKNGGESTWGPDKRGLLPSYSTDGTERVISF